MILGSDLDPTGLEVLDGLIAAAVSELEFEGLSAEGLPEKLVSQADPEHRYTRINQATDLAHDGSKGGGIARSVGKEDAGGFAGEDIRGGRVGGNNADAEAVLSQATQDVVFDPEIVGDNGDVGGRKGQSEVAWEGVGGAAALGEAECPAVGISGIPVKGFGMGYLTDVIAASHGAPGAGAGDGFFGVKSFGGEGAGHGAVDAEAADEGAGIDALDAWDTVLGEVRGEILIGAPIGDDRAEFADDEPGGMGSEGFHIDLVDAVIADLRIGHGDDLPAVGGVGEDLLITGHGSVEAHFTDGGGSGTKGFSVEDGAIGKGENGGSTHVVRAGNRRGRQRANWRGLWGGVRKGQTMVAANAGRVGCSITVPGRKDDLKPRISGMDTDGGPQPQGGRVSGNDGLDHSEHGEVRWVGGWQTGDSMRVENRGQVCIEDAFAPQSMLPHPLHCLSQA